MRETYNNIDFAIFFYRRERKNLNLSTLTTLGERLAGSLKHFYPDSRITHLTDVQTPQLEGCNHSLRLDIPLDKPMLARLSLHAAYRHQRGRSTVFLDADMLMVQPLPQLTLAINDVILCRRSFNCNTPFSGKFMHGDFAEHSGKPLDQVFPALACFTVTASNSFWVGCLSLLGKMDTKYHHWFGDQEAIRQALGDPRFRFRMIPEAIVACPPERPEANVASILHYKGKVRKRSSGPPPVCRTVCQGSPLTRQIDPHDRINHQAQAAFHR